MLVFTGFPANSLYKGEPMGFNGGLMGIWQSCKQTMGLLWTISKILSDKQPMGLIDGKPWAVCPNYSCLS